MTIQECYASLEGDYQEVLGRLYSDALVQRFVGKFLSDQSFQQLEDSLKAENYDDAFRAAHTLKGVSQNLSFTKLYNSVNELAETLRPEDADVQKAGEQFLDVERDYKQTVEAIRTLQAEG